MFTERNDMVTKQDAQALVERKERDERVARGLGAGQMSGSFGAIGCGEVKYLEDRTVFEVMLERREQHMEAAKAISAWLDVNPGLRGVKMSELERIMRVRHGGPL